jgi:hypothetical protein
MKRIVLVLMTVVVLMGPGLGGAVDQEVTVQGKRLVSQKPPFKMSLPSEMVRVHSFSTDYPQESSRTRGYFLIKETKKQIEEMFILQIADRTDPQSEPIRAPSLKPDLEKRMLAQGRIKKSKGEIDYLIQSFAWNPGAPSLQPIIKQGFSIPSHWAFQGQFLFAWEGEHVVLVRISRDVQSYGLKVSEKAEAWNREALQGNEKKSYEAFRQKFMDMIESVVF